jgi:ribosomal protein S27AE
MQPRTEAIARLLTHFGQPLPAFAQDPQKPTPDEKEKDDKKGSDDKYEKKLVDGEGRVYRICPQCGYNMYKQKRMWVCENCGYSYVE